jgi:hypothetical protein
LLLVAGFFAVSALVFVVRGCCSSGKLGLDERIMGTQPVAVAHQAK